VAQREQQTQAVVEAEQQYLLAQHQVLVVLVW
jgi:hypothetical protein